MGVWVPRAHKSSLPEAAIQRVTGGEPILRASDLAIGYLAPVQEHLNLALPEGVSTVITGPNGAGKTTLALTLAGLLPKLGGSVSVAERLRPGGRADPFTWKSRELLTRIGTVFQQPEHQFVAASVHDELAAGLRALKRPDSQIEAKVNALLDLLHLRSLSAANPFTLSGGEKRRLSVGTVLAVDPALIVLDEPTFGQDRRTWVDLVSLITRLRDEGTTICSVTHDQGYIEALGEHRIALIPESRELVPA
jgi:energy-coupling factor transport system ATP-binding protein